MMITRIIKGFMKIGLCIWCNLFEYDEEPNAIEESSVTFLGKIISPLIMMYVMYKYVQKRNGNQRRENGLLDSLSFSTLSTANTELLEDDQISNHGRINQNERIPSQRTSLVSLHQEANVEINPGRNENLETSPNLEENYQLRGRLPDQGVYRVRSSRLLDQNGGSNEPNMAQMVEERPNNDVLEIMRPRRGRRPRRRQ